MTRNISPELRFTFECIRQVVDPRKVRSPERSAECHPHWDLVAEQASTHGLIPVVWSILGELRERLPPEVRDRVEADYLAAVIRMELGVEPVVRRALRALQDAGLRPIVLKGAALAYTSYPAPVYRTFADLDLLLEDDDLGPASRILGQIGFATDRAAVQPSHHLIVQVEPELALGVELHHQLIRQPNPYKFDLEGLRTRAQEADIAGVEASVLSPEDALFFTGVHVAYAHHYWSWYPLRSLMDILAITTHHTDRFDWELFVDTAKHSRAMGAVFWPLRLGKAWLDAPIPDSVLSELAPPMLTRRLLEAVAEPEYVINRHAPAGSDGLYQLLWECALHQGCTAGDQLAALVRWMFPPPSEDRRLASSLTRSRLRYAAYLARPGRFARCVVALGGLLGRLVDGESRQASSG